MKRFQSYSAACALLALCFTLFLPTASAANTGVGIVINGNAVSFTQDSGSPFIDASSRTQVPLRATMEAYGCSVAWEQSSQTAVVSKGETNVRVPIGQPYIVVNGLQRPNDTAALVENDRTYLPIRAVLEAFGGYVSWDGAQNSVLVDSSSPLLKLFFLDVGQGDAILIDSGSLEVLIDAGDNSAGQTVVSALRPYVDGALDYIIATHSDADHIGGMDDVLYAYTVSEIIDSGYAATSATYRDYQAAAKQEGCTLSLDENRVLDLGNGVTLRIIETGDHWQNPNDSSVVAELSYGTTKVLFTGDLSETVEQQTLSLFSDVDVLKVGHHGSATSTSAAFLSVVKPDYAVLSYAPGNRYHHPTAATLQRLLNAGTICYGTGKSGTIVLSTNGAAYNFQQSNALTLADAGTATSATPSVPQPQPTPTPAPTQPDNTGVPAAEASCMGNNKSKKYHTLTCRYATSTMQNNRVYFRTDADAQAAGYVPCQVCH